MQILLRIHETAKVSVRMYANLLVLRLCVHFGSSSERAGESQAKPAEEAGAAATRISCGLPHTASQSLFTQASQGCPNHSLGADLLPISITRNPLFIPASCKVVPSGSFEP